MTAIISGNGLGLFNSSLNQLGGALGGHPGLGQSQNSQYVNIATGNLIMQGEDERLLSGGLLVAQVRTYNSRGVLASTAPSGVDCWTFGFETTVRLATGVVNVAGSTVERTLGDGTRVTFAYDAQAGLYRSAAGDGAHDTIAYDAATATWTWTEGSSLRQEVYEASKGLLIKIRDLKTGAENTLVRDSSGLLDRVVTQSGDALLFTYDGPTKKLTSVSTLEGGVTRTQVRYGYDSKQRLSLIEVDLTPGTWSDNDLDARRSFITSYEYADDTPRIKRASRGLTQSDGVEVSYDYYVGGANNEKVRSVTVGSVADGSAQTLEFTYDTVNRSTDVTDAAGRTWTYKYDAAGQLLEVVSPAENGLRQVTKCEYNTAGDLTKVIDAENRITVYEYDAHGNVTLQRDHAGNTIRRTYDANNQLLTEASFVAPDADGSGPAQPTGALVTRYVYDERSRVAFVLEPQGEVTHYQYDSLTGLVGTILKVHSQRYPIAGLAEQQAPSRQDMTDWLAQVYVGDGTGQAPPIARTDFGYDARGLLAHKTIYAQVDANGLGVLDAEAVVTGHIYDAQGLLLQQIAYRGADRSGDDVVSHTYDGMGRILSSTDAAGNATHWIYDDAGQRLKVTQANGLVRTEARDKAGRTIAVTESAAGNATTRTTRRYYDTVGRVRATEDASGARTYFFYDAVGRVVAEVDTTGAVTEYQQDKTGRALQTIRYATRVDTSAWLSGGAVQPQRLADIRPATDAVRDRTTEYAYDAAGRLLTETDAEKTITTYGYDGASRVVRVTVDRPGDLGAVPRVTRHFYDDSGRKTAVLDAEGHLTEHRYDAAGREIAVVRYARATDEAQRADGSLADLRPLTDAADQVTRFFYNGRHLKAGELNAEGYLTEYVYDEASNQRAMRVYNKRLEGLTGSESFATLRSQAQPDGMRETRRTFDARGLLNVELNAEGTVTKYHYDVMGRLVGTEAADATTEERNGNLRFDVFGNLVGELGGEGSAHLLPNMTEAQKDAIYAQYGVRHSYDVLGRRLESIDAEGNKTWYFYDVAGRLTQTVRGVADENGVRNASGEVVETRYNTFGQAVDTTAYTGRIAIGVPFGRDQAAAAIRVLQYVAGRDSRNSFEYDRRGLMTARTDAEGYRTWRAYNAFGDLTRQTRTIDAQRVVTTEYTYDRLGWLQTTVEDAAGLRRELKQTWDAFGRITSTVDGRDNTTFHDYDRLGRQVVQRQLVAGREEAWSTGYDAHGRVVTQTDPLGHATRYSYDDATRSVVVTTPEQVTLRTERNRHGETFRVVDAFGQATSYTYDLDGHLVATTTADGQVTDQDFDTRGLLTRTTDASGRAVAYRYDAVGRVLERIEDPNALALTTRYEYDGQGRQVLTTDPAGSKTRVHYDGNGQLKEVVRDEGGLNLRTTYAWDGLGRQLSVTEAAGTAVARTALYQYDNLGRRVTETQAAGTLNLLTSYEYDGNDNLVRRTDAEQRVSRYVYDAANRLTLEVDAAGGVTRTWHDAAGRPVATRRYARAIDLTGLSNTPSASDIESRLLTDDARDLQEYRVLDRDGRVRLGVDGSGGVTSMDYDAAGRLVASHHYATTVHLDSALRAQLQSGAIEVAAFAKPAASGQDRVDHRVYDVVGRLRYTIDGSGNVQQLDYDAAGRNVGTRRYATALVLDAQVRAKLAAGTATAGDIAARLVADPAHDLRSYQVADSAGRVRYTVDALGNVQEHFVDETGRTVGSRRYATTIAIDASLAARLAAGTVTPAEVAAKVVVNDARDLRSYQVLDALGRVRYSIDAVGSVSEFQFDATGNLLGSRTYASTLPLDPQLLARLRDGTATPNEIATHPELRADDARDARNLQLLDAAGRMRFVVDAAGYVQESRYDATGMLVQQLAYTTALPATDMAAIATGALLTADLATRLAPQEAGARLTALVRDQAGRLRYTLTRDTAATAVVQELRYDGAGQLVAEVAYARSIGLATPRTVADVAAAITAAGGDAGSQQRITRYVHDSAGQVRFSVDNAGAVTEQRFDGAGRVVESRSYGQWIAAGTPATEAGITAALADSADVRTTKTIYDAAGRIGTIVDALNHEETFRYDGIGQKVSYTNRDQHTWNYSYDASGRLAEEISPPVNVSWFDAVGGIETESREIITRIAYDALGNVVARTENAYTDQARTTEYRYDNRGHQIGTVFPDAGHFDAATLQLLATGERPTTAVVYDALGRAVVQKDVRNQYSYRVYDAVGQLSYEVDQAGYVTGYRYDAYGQQTELTRYANAISLPAGQPVALEALEGQLPVAPAQDRTLSTRYDLRGQKFEVLQDAVTYYDGAGNLLQGQPATRFEYDAYGQLVREAVLLEGDPNAASARWAETYRYYDAVGRNTVTVDAEGYVTTLRYNAQGQVLEQTDHARVLTGSWSVASQPLPPPVGDAASGYDRSVSFAYDALGRKVGETAVRHGLDSNGNDLSGAVVTTIGYDNEGHALTTRVDDTTRADDITRLDATTILAGTTTSTAYDALGRVISVLEAERDVLRNDAGSQLGSIGTDLGSASLYERSSPYTEMFYDAFGNNVMVQRYVHGLRPGEVGMHGTPGDQVHLTRYDHQGRSVWEKDAVGTTYVRRYDAADNLLETRYRLAGTEGRSAEVVIAAQYDGLGRQVISSVLREAYQGAGRLLKNGLPVDETDAQSTVRYNAFGEIVAKDDRIEGAFAANRPFAQYEYDAAGRLTRSNAEGGNWRDYGYNLAGHQVRESHQVRLGNELEGTLAYQAAVTISHNDRLGRVIEQRLPLHSDHVGAVAAVIQQRYDRWGNVVEVVDPNRGRTQYEYNELNQAVREIRPEVKVLRADGTEQRERPQNRWFYDVLGRLVGTRDANGNARQTQYDATGRVIASLDANSKVTKLAYDALGQQRLTQDPLGYLTFREFDNAGRITAQGDYLTDAAGAVRTRNVREEYVLNQNGDRLRVADALGNTALYDYDSRGLLLRSRTAGGVLMSYGYDSQGRKVRETNAVSDPSLLTATQPVYRGGLLTSQVSPVGQAFSYAVPTNAFTVPTGETPVLTATIQLSTGYDQWQATDALRFENGVLSGTPGEGFYRITLTATGSSGQFTQSYISLSVLSQERYNTEYAGNPIATMGLHHPELDFVQGQPFIYQLPSGLFVDPQNQSLTITAGTWVTPRPRRGEPGEPLEEQEPRFVVLPTTPTSTQWLTFDPSTGVFSGTPRSTAPLTVIVQATDPDGHTTSLSLTLKPRASGLSADGRRAIVDQDEQAGTETVYLDEQTWDYNYFGQVTDHNDLGGADYDYGYDPITGQQVAQSSRWTEGAREYSTPLLDRWEDDYWYRNGLDGVREDLILPVAPELVNNPERTLTYYPNGQLKQIREGRNWTNYEYDASGNRTREETVTHDRMQEGTGTVQLLHLDTRILYDAHNRIVKVTQDDAGANRRLLELRYDYDAVGNRRRVLARGAYDGAQLIGFDNQPPVVNQAIAPQHVILGEAWSFRVPADTFRDPENGPLRIEASMADGSPMPAWLTFDRATRTFRGTPTETTHLTLRLTAFDLDDRSVSSDFVVTVSANQPPEVIGAIEAQTAYVGLAWSLPTAGVFADPEGRPLTYSATLIDGSALPGWLQIDAGSGRLSGVPGAAAALSVRVIATDSVGASVAIVFDLSVQEHHAPYNLDFELGDTGWIKGSGWGISTGESYSGAWSARLTAPGISSITNEKLVAVQSGAVYTASMMVSSRSGSAAELILEWHDANGQFISFIRGNLVKSGAWARSSVTGTPPAGAAFLRIAGSARIDPGEGAVLLDRFTLTGPVGGSEPPPPQPADVKNLNFELGNTGWIGTGISIVQEAGADSGGWVARRDYTGGTAASIRAVHAVAVTAGQSVTATAMMQAYGADDQVGGQVRILWLDANRQLIGNVAGNEINVTNGQGWRPSTATGVAPGGAAFVELQGDSFALQAGGVVLFDSFTVSVTGDGSTPADADNLAFELGDSGWNKGAGWSIVPSGGQGSAWSARYDGGNTPSSISNAMRVPVQAGETFSASCWVQQGASSAGDASGAVVIEWYDANGNGLGWNTGNVVSSGSGGAWHQSTVTATAPEGAAFMSIAGNARKSTGHSLWLDNFTFHRVEGGGGAPETWKSYWYSYDAENRVAVTNGQLVDGEILLGSNDISYALDYDDAGRATRRRFNQAGTTMVETTAYDARGQRTAVFQAVTLGTADPAAWSQTFRYDAAGRTTERREYFGADAVHRNGVAIGGWLKHAEVFSYDADGRVLRQDVKGRALDWVAYAAPPPPTPPAPVFTSSGPGAPTIGVAPWDPAGEFVRGFAGGFTLDAGTFVDADAPLTFEKTAGPSWLQYTTQADGSHRFHGTPPADGLSRSPTVTLKATDAQGNWTALTFHIWVEGEEFEPGPTPPGTHPQMMAMAQSQSVSASNPQVDDLNYLSHLSRVDYSQYGYDAAGRLRGYEYSYALHEDGSGAKATDPKGYMHRFVFQYEARESYLEKQVFGRSSDPLSNFRASSTASTYDAWGRRTAVRETTPLPRNLGTIPDRIRYFSYDAEGNILRRREGEFKDNAFTQSAAHQQQTQTYAYVGGQQVAAGKQNGELDIVGRLTAYQSSEAGSVSITVQAGDTLRSIAQRIYGNSNLWYVLAEANAITDEQLTAGTTLRVPEVKVTANDATTFKPFNPAEAIGNTAPSLPYIAPPPKQHCNVLAIILIIVVAIVVSVATYGAASGHMSAWAAGAIAGAAGSVASQAVGSAMGVMSFSWRQVAVDAVVGGVTAGVSTAAQAGKLGAILKASTWARAAATAVVGQVAGYAANKAVGNEAHFSWKAIAASAVAAGISAGIGEKLNLNPSTGIPGGSGSFAKDLANGMIGGVVSVHTRRAFGFDDKINYGMIAADAFGNAVGNALGNAAVRGIGTWQANRARRQATAGSFLDRYPNATASGYGSENRLGSPDIMSTDGAGGFPANDDHLRLYADDEQLRQSQADIDMLRSQGRDTSAAQAALDELWTRRYVGANRSEQLKTLNSLFDTPLDSNVSDAELAELTKQYAPASSGNVDTSIPTLETVKAVAVPEYVAGYASSWMYAYGAGGSSTQNWRMQGVQPASVQSWSKTPFIKHQSQVQKNIDWNAVEGFASYAGHGAVATEQVLLYAAKKNGQNILRSAGTLQHSRMKSVAAATNMDDAAKVFKNPNGKTAAALAKSASSYGRGLRAVPLLGTAATAVEEGAYLADVQATHPDKLGEAAVATAVNVGGDWAATIGGMKGGAAAGALPFLSGPTFGLSIPIGAAIGGFIGHYSYDQLVKPEVREALTGIPGKDE